MDTYGEPKIIEFPGLVARVFSPILTEEERTRRMKKIHDAAARLIMSAEKLNKGEKNNGKGFFDR
jgi:hypothetical protein